MLFHVILTTECNLQCRYCYGEALKDVDSDFPDLEIDYSLPNGVSYDVNLLDRFCRQDPECVLIFYGGEPLIRSDDIRRIMENVKAKHFIVQTNGLYLDRLEPALLNRFHTILISIDGDEALTDLYRGKGTFRKVVSKLKLIRENGFKGELIARMTIMEQTDIYKQVTWLVDNDEFTFSSVHWQLNAGFWTDFGSRDFERWCKENYDPGISKLVKFWVDYMKNRGEVLKLYPFLGIVQSLLSNEEKSLLRCGAGWMNYAIQTDGYIVPCPSMWGMKNCYLGHICYANPLNLRRFPLGEPCTKCDIFDVCGGRCLYANITSRWDLKEYSLVCGTVRNLIDAIIDELSQVRKLIELGRIRLKDFEFLKYNGCEIIP